MCGRWWLSAIGYDPLGTTSTPKMVSLLPSSSYQIPPTRDPKMNRSNTKKGFRRWNSIKVARDGRWINGRIPATSVTASAQGGHNLAADHRSFCLLPCASNGFGWKLWRRWSQLYKSPSSLGYVRQLFFTTHLRLKSNVPIYLAGLP